MKCFKILGIITIALLALLLSLQVLGRAKANTLAPDDLQPQLAGPSSDNLTTTKSITINLWLMPDFKTGEVWVDGDVSDPERQPLPLQNGSVISWSNEEGRGHHFFGRWTGGVVTISPTLTGAHEIRLPGLALEPEDKLNIKLVSGVVLTDTLFPRPVTSTATMTRTLGLTLAFNATEILSPTPGLTGSYTLTGLPVSQSTGQFVVSPIVTLTTSYTLPDSATPRNRESSSQTVPITSPFTYTLHAAYGEFSGISLTKFSTRPITLTIPFYPFEKAIDLTLVPLLVETMMPPEASATGGAISRRFSGHKYAQAGLLGRGDIRMRIRAIEDDPDHSAIALLIAFRKYRLERGQAGPNRWRGGLGRLLERSLDFPSFPTLDKVGELNLHKKTIIEIVTREMSHTVQSDMPGLLLEAPFHLWVWQLKTWQGEKPLTPTLPASYSYNDFNYLKEDEQELRMRLGKIMLGPQDVLTLTMESVVWVFLDPLPAELADNGPERNGFTAVYHGPRSFWLDIRYTPHPRLFAQQSVAGLRGLSRVWEHWWGQFIKGGWSWWVFALLLILWIFYQIVLSYKTQMLMQILRPLLMLTYLAALLAISNLGAWSTFLTTLRLFVNEGTWSTLVPTLRLLVNSDTWHNIPMPFAILIVNGAWLLLRKDIVLSKRGLYLFMVIIVSLGIELLVNGLYSGPILNALKYSSASGMLSGATSLALLIEIIALLAMLFWLSRPKKNTLKNEDLHAFAFAALAAATFEVTDASLFAIAVLFLVWSGLSWWIDTANPLVPKSPKNVTTSPKTTDKSKDKTNDSDNKPASEKSPNVKSILWSSTTLIVARVTIVICDLLKKTLNWLQPKQEIESEKNSLTGNISKQTKASRVSVSNPPSDKSSDTSQEKQSTPTGASSGDNASKKKAPKSLDPFDKKLREFLKPWPIGIILVAAIILSQDPLLHTQMAAFPQSDYVSWWILVPLFLDSLARLATTLVLSISIVLLMVILDTTIEHWRRLKFDKTDDSLDTYLKAIPLGLVLFSIFLLGIGGLDIFTGAIGLKLSSRIIYYFTVPLLTGLWLDWQPAEGERSWEKFKETLDKNLTGPKQWISTALVLLSILAPRLLSPVTAEQADSIIKTLQTLQF